MPRRRTPPAPIIPSMVDITNEALRNIGRNDMLDSMMMTMNAGHAQRDAERERQRAMERRPPVRVEMTAEHRADTREEHRRVDVEVLGWNTSINIQRFDEMRFPTEELHRQIAREVTARMADQVYEAIMQQMPGAEARLQESILRAMMHGTATMPVGGPGMWRQMHEGVRHGVDLARGQLDRHVLKTVPLKPWFKHKHFEFNGWLARLIETEEQIAAEGENMQHCFGTSYRSPIAKEKYIAYHITAPDRTSLPRSGFTLGFHVLPGIDNNADVKRFNFDQVKGKKNSMHYIEHPELKAMIALIDSAINERLAQADPAMVETREVSVA